MKLNELAELSDALLDAAVEDARPSLHYERNTGDVHNQAADEASCFVQCQPDLRYGREPNAPEKEKP